MISILGHLPSIVHFRPAHSFINLLFPLLRPSFLFLALAISLLLSLQVEGIGQSDIECAWPDYKREDCGNLTTQEQSNIPGVIRKVPVLEVNPRFVAGLFHNLVAETREIRRHRI